MKFEKSCGVIVYRRNQEHIDLLLVKNRYGGHWSSVSYTHLRAHETRSNLVCRLLLEKNFF